MGRKILAALFAGILLTGCASGPYQRPTSRVFGETVVDVPVVVIHESVLRQFRQELERSRRGGDAPVMLCVSAQMHRVNAMAPGARQLNLPGGVTFWEVIALVRTANPREWCRTGFQGMAVVKNMSYSEAVAFADSTAAELLTGSETLGFILIPFAAHANLQKNPNPLCRLTRLQRRMQGYPEFMDCSMVTTHGASMVMRIKQTVDEDGNFVYNHQPRVWIIPG